MHMIMNITHKHYLFTEKYNLGAPGTGFLITPTFIKPGENSKGPSSDSSKNLA